MLLQLTLPLHMLHPCQHIKLHVEWLNWQTLNKVNNKNWNSEITLAEKMQKKELSFNGNSFPSPWIGTRKIKSSISGISRKKKQFTDGAIKVHRIRQIKVHRRIMPTLLKWSEWKPQNVKKLNSFLFCAYFFTTALKAEYCHPFTLSMTSKKTAWKPSMTNLVSLCGERKAIKYNTNAHMQRIIFRHKKRTQYANNFLLLYMVSWECAVSYFSITIRHP